MYIFQHVRDTLPCQSVWGDVQSLGVHPQHSVRLGDWHRESGQIYLFCKIFPALPVKDAYMTNFWREYGILCTLHSACMLTWNALSWVHMSTYSVAELWPLFLQNQIDTLKLLIFIFLNSHVSSSLIITYMEDWQLSLNTLSADIWSILMGETGKPQKKVLTTSALSCSKFTFSPKTGRHCLKHSMMLSSLKGLLSNCQVSWYCRRLTGGWSNVTQLRRWMLLDCVAHLCTTSMKLLHVAHYIQN